MKLLRSVDSAILLDPIKMPPNFVTMHSVVSLGYVDTGRKREVCLVYPEEADAGQNRIFIFAPLATTLVGCTRGTLVSMPTIRSHL